MWLTLGWRWGISGIGRGGSTGVVVAGISLYLVWLSLSTYYFAVLWLSMAFVIDPFSSFSGVRFVQMGQLTMGGSAAVGDGEAAED